MRQSDENSRDDHIGLTEAFAPVTPDDEDGDRIGLTQAFAPIDGESRGAHAGGFSYQGDHDDEYPDAFDALEPRDRSSVVLGEEAPVPADEPVGRHGRAAAPQGDGQRSGKNGKKGKKKDKDAAIPAYQRKSRKMRKILIVVVILLVLIIAALAYFAVQWVGESQRVAVQQAQTQQGSQDVDTLKGSESSSKDASSTTAKKTEVPNLANLLGKTQDESVAALQHGATVLSSKDQNEEGNPVKKNVTIALTAEPADSRSGTPTVYLGLGEDGKVVQAGYSAATASLGYGSLSFSDAVSNEHIVEKTLREAGVSVPDGAAQLPADKTTYSTYGSDGTTLVKESCPFSGTVQVAGQDRKWSSVLLYDYATANSSGNLADTVRMIYVYINA